MVDSQDTSCCESWKPVPISAFSSSYSVSSRGRVRREAPGTRGCIVGKILKNNRDRKGYLCVTLVTTSGKIVARIHRIVAAAFIGNPTTERPHVNHKNSNPQDNRVENLEWVSRSENMAHCSRAGRHGSVMCPESVPRGEKSYQSKVTEEQVREIRRLAEFSVPYSEISSRYGISTSAVWKIKFGHSWKSVA